MYGPPAPVESKTINVGSLAFLKAKCCSLTSTLGHEATHKAFKNASDEYPGPYPKGYHPLDIERKCFGC